MYRTQPNVFAVVNYRAEQVAGIKLKHYAKVPDSDLAPFGRLEMKDSALQLLLDHPSPTVSRYRLWKTTVMDLSLYGVAYWRKTWLDGQVRALTRVLPSALIPDHDPVTNVLRWYNTAKGDRVYPNELVVFHGYDPELDDGYTSPLESLRRILSEEHAAGINREYTWRNEVRKSGVVERPETAPVWSDDQREAWRLETEGIMSGHTNAGRLLLLEDGMKYRDSAWSPQEMEYLEGRKLTRQESAAAFGIDPRLVFASDDAATKEARDGFYQDHLHPLLIGLAEEVDVQLLPEFEPFGFESQYTEFNFDSKLRGSLMDEAKFLSMATGMAWMKPNEARARHNLFPTPEGQNLVVPLNVALGGQASPQAPLQTPGDEPADGETPGPKKVIVSMTPEEVEAIRQMWVQKAAQEADKAEAEQKAWLDAEKAYKASERLSEALRRHLARQGKTVISLARALARRGPVTVDDLWIDAERWDRELTDDLTALGLNGDSEDAAKAFNEMTRMRLGEILAAGLDVREAFRSDGEVLT